MTSAPLATYLSQLATTTPRTRSFTLPVTKAPRHSRDAPILAELLGLHAVARPRIIDCTYGKGGIWGRLPIRASVVKVDINPDLPGLDLVADWRDLPRHFARASFDVQVCDPIHGGDVGRTSKRYARYVAAQNPVKGPSIAPLFPGIFDAAEWLLRPRVGVLLIKIVDLVRSGRFQPESHRLARYAESRGWTFCQYVAMWSPPTTLPNRRHQYHLDNGCALWLVLRNGPACHGPGRRLKHEFRCTVCGANFSARRSDARTCPGGRCRQRRHRQGAEAVQP